MANIVVIILSIVMAIIGLLLCGIILLQNNRSAGLGAISGAADSDSYWSKNRGNSMEGALEKYTKIGGALFMIIGIIINFLI